MSTSDQDLFLAYVRAYNARDVPRMMTFFADGCVFENISGGRLTVRTVGKAELEELARRSADAFESREQRIIWMVESAGRLAVEIEYDAILRTSLSPEMKAGQHLHLRGVSICEIRGGQIVRLSDYS